MRVYMFNPLPFARKGYMAPLPNGLCGLWIKQPMDKRYYVEDALCTTPSSAERGLSCIGKIYGAYFGFLGFYINLQGSASYRTDVFRYVPIPLENWTNMI